MSAITLLFPHQLFEDNPAVDPSRNVMLVEETLFFNQYQFHKQKLAFHRASMKFYEDFLRDQGIEIEYIEATDPKSDIRELVPQLKPKGVREIHYIDVSDNWLRNRLTGAAEESGITITEYDSSLFLNSLSQVREYFRDKDSYYQTDFYIDQRKRRGILVDKDEKPVGGKWSFDAENREKYPKGKEAPAIQFPAENRYYDEAERYVEDHFNGNYGQLGQAIRYPVTYGETRDWLQQFLEWRFNEFGDYQDAIVRDEPFLHHSILTPMLNVGLITPQQVVDHTMEYAEQKGIPLNTLEGFIRQIMGWREFIRAVYELEGTTERNGNFWGFDRKIPPSFWEGTTGIEPVDVVIKRVLKTGYAHHIERLMVLGNFMLLCEFDPDEVYRWFMELFVDAYDWVMVPNVYGMSQFADGGLMATKPYISSSNYIRKMSNFGKGDWEPIWDGLFWRFMHKHRSYFEQNHRVRMLVSTLARMSDEKLTTHLTNADEYLSGLK